MYGGGCRGGVVKSTKWEAGLALVGVGVRRVEGSSARAQSRPPGAVTFGNENPWKAVRHAGEA